MDATGSSAFACANPVQADRSERRPTRMRGHILAADGSHHEIHVADLSYEGCGIETATALEPGQRVKLSVLNRGGIDSEVRWCRGGKAGLVFLPPAQEASARRPRKAGRQPLTAEIVLRRIGRSAYRMTATDASLYGCKVELVERTSVGEQVLVKFDCLDPMEARVRWVEGYTAGLEFARPIHPAVFDLLVERLKD